MDKVKTKLLLSFILFVGIANVSCRATDYVWMDLEYHDQAGTVLKKDGYVLNYAATNCNPHYWVEYRDGNDPKWDHYHKHIDEHYIIKDDCYVLKDYSTHDSYHKDAKEDYGKIKRWLEKKFPGCSCTVTEYKERHDGTDYQIVELKLPSSWCDSSSNLWIFIDYITVE